MAQNKNTKKSEGICRKIHNAISPFRSRIYRDSHQPHNSISITNDPKSSQNPKPVNVLHQPSLSKMVPVELEPSPHKNKKVVRKRGQEFGEREILIAHGEKYAKTEQAPAFPACGQAQKVVPTKDKPTYNQVSFGKAKSNKEDDSAHESRFNDYIDKVRTRLLKTASSVKDSFKEVR